MRMTLTINIAVWHSRVHACFSLPCLPFFVRYVPFDIEHTQLNDFSTSWMHENSNNNNNILQILSFLYMFTHTRTNFFAPADVFSLRLKIAKNSIVSFLSLLALFWIRSTFQCHDALICLPRFMFFPLATWDATKNYHQNDAMPCI